MSDHRTGPLRPESEDLLQVSPPQQPLLCSNPFLLTRTHTRQRSRIPSPSRISVASPPPNPQNPRLPPQPQPQPQPQPHPKSQLQRAPAPPGAAETGTGRKSEHESHLRVHDSRQATAERHSSSQAEPHCTRWERSTSLLNTRIGERTKIFRSSKCTIGYP